MGYITVLCLLAACFHLCLSDEFCPAANLIAPCNCDREGINCMNIKSDSELQRVFRAIPRPWKFRGVWIYGTDVTTLPSGMFQGIEVQAFHIEINRIRNIGAGAFKGSEQSCYVFSVFGNELADGDWDELKKFTYLQSFNAGRNRLTSLPEKAFYGLQYLGQILLPENRISYIGPNAFNGLPSLVRLDLLHNRLNVLGPFSLAMNNHNQLLTVNLANCSISSIAPTAFNGMTPVQLNLALNNLQYLDESVFSPLVRRMSLNGGQIVIAANPLTCVGCTYRWIVLNKQVLMQTLVGFLCTDYRDLSSLNLININCLLP